MATVRSYLICVLIIAFRAVEVNSNVPDATGGYAITLALQENTPQPEEENGTLVLIENIQKTLSSFSEKLWLASRNQFYIKSVDILVPSSWTLENVTHSVNQNYDASAIRISSSPDVQARADNPFECGKPGNFIELPKNFFDNTDTGRYGPNWKALLNLWASYRWGVHEEHGYVGSSKYPYSHKNLETEEWEVTGCSNYPITGSFMTNESAACSASDTQNPSSTCRFIPNQSSTNATTSIMHFHFIDSVVGFCDETNHNKLSPNRHNSMCDHKSVWEVIRVTRDFQVVSSPINETIPSVAFKVVQHSKKPRFYILLDRGSIQGSIGLASQIPRAITTFLNDAEQADTVAAVSTFPGSEGEGSIQQEIEWSTVQEKLETFVDVIGDLRIGGPLQRDFAQSILSAVNKIKATANSNGVVMLVVKYGADLSSFANYIPEAEVIQALNEQGIILNAIELSITDHSGHSHLAQLARETGGTYTVISNLGEADSSLGNVFWYLSNLLDEDNKELRKNYRSIVRTEIRPGSTTRFRIPKLSANDTQDNAGSVEAYFSTEDGSLSLKNFTVEGVNVTDGSVVAIDKVLFRKRQDWEEKESKWTYLLKLLHDEMVNLTEVSIRTTCQSCHGTVLIRTNLVDTISQNITISVITNIEDSLVDLSRNGPITIFAKIQDSGLPVVGAYVSALITDIDRQTTSYLNLADNGEGAPDEDAFDGVYSGYFAPNRDSQYKISVSVQSSQQRHSTVSKSVQQSRLLPIDQEMGCVGATCDSSELPAGFMQSIDLLANVRVSNSADYTPEPTRISWFIANPDSASDTITLMWLAPQIPGLSFISATTYDVRYSASKNDLISDFENQQQVPGTSTMKPGAPGSLETIRLTRPTQTTFYAMRAVYRGQKSKMSAVSEIEIRDQEETTTSSPVTEPTTTSASEDTTTSSITDVTTPEVTVTDGTTPEVTVTEVTSSDSTVTEVTSTDTESTASTSSDQNTEPTDSASSPTPEPEPEDKKPWAKTGAGIAIITVIVLIVVAVILLLVYYFLRKRGKVAKINPPPKPKARSSIPLE